MIISYILHIPTMEIDLNTRTLRSIADDPVRSARAAELVYVNDQEPGIRREKKGKSFVYFSQNRRVEDAPTLKRIASLVIPPAWSDVWICTRANGHLQATGLDTRSRKQYRYHPRWVALRGQTKFYRLGAFGRALPQMRKRIKADLHMKGLPLTKVLALLVSLMEQTHIRIGNDFYRRLYGSFGLATLQCRHVKLKGAGIHFAFKGKKGVAHDITIHNRKLAGLITRCKEIPGRHLFQYYDSDNEPQAVHSEDVNEYIRQIAGTGFTSKDFRTWAGSTGFIRAFMERSQSGTGNDLVELIDQVAKSLGNTRSVCRKYYIHPAVVASFEAGTLERQVHRVTRATAWMSREERILLKILSQKN